MVFHETAIGFQQISHKKEKGVQKIFIFKVIAFGMNKKISGTSTLCTRDSSPFCRPNDNSYKTKNSTGITIPIINRIPPRPQNPFEPFTITSPVKVIRMRQIAKASLKVVHQRPGL